MFPNAAFDLVVIAASSGGVFALKHLVTQLPPDFSAPIAVVQHLSAAIPSQLATLLEWGSRLPVRFARDHERLRGGSVVVAPPGRHLVVGPHGRFALEDSDKRNHARPAADRLFASAADAFGSRVLAVVLTGLGCDGAAGAAHVRANGGLVIVQDPAEAHAPSMPMAALQACRGALVIPLGGVAHALTQVKGTRELFNTERQRLSA